MEKTLGRSPEVQDVLEGSSQGNVIIRPTEDPYFVYKVSSIPDDDVSQFVSGLGHGFYEVDVDRNASILPPEVCHIDDAMRLRLVEAKEAGIDLSDDVSITLWLHRSEIFGVCRVLLHLQVMFVLSKVPTDALVQPFSVEHVSIWWRGDT